MTAASDLTAALATQVKLLEDDLRTRVESQPEVKVAWQTEHKAAVKDERTAAAWGTWRDEQVTLVAVSWVLTTVFIRFCEDNDLLKPVWIAPCHRRQEAADAYAEFFRDPAHRTGTDREWLLEAVNYLKSVPATKGLVDEHAPLWKVSPSGDAVTRLLEFWRERDDAGRLVHGTDDGETGGFHDEELSARFLGDLYENLSEEAKERFALLQTPEFVEEFILDHTLTPALKDRSLEGFSLVDPTCGSGHFLLGAFPRLLEAWSRHDEALEIRARVQKVLDSIHGVDINPYAVAIARFRLTIVATQTSGFRRLEAAPDFHINLACGDALLHGDDQTTLYFDGTLDQAEIKAGFGYTSEDLYHVRRILKAYSHDVVVGNPPYITVKDKAANKRYRRRYPNLCKGTYALTVPFMAQFFMLARGGDRPGWVGQITSNSFIKREFGVPLVEHFLPNKDLRLVADTSGAFIPGHGTPTVIIVGRNQPMTNDRVRAVLGIRGEPRRPDEPENGLVWSSIRDHADETLAVGESWENRWVTVTDIERSWLKDHPWTLAGGGAIELKRTIEATKSYLRSRITPPIGRSVRIGADEAFLRPRKLILSGKIPENDLRPMLTGEDIRDWHAAPESLVWYPYIYGTPTATDKGISRELWPWRTLLANRATFEGNMADAGYAWWQYMQHTSSAYSLPLSINFAFVATHNNFALDRGGVVFNRSAPAIKLPANAGENRHLELLGPLNSSTGCFWLKQVSHDKGSQGVNEGIKAEPWERFYEFTGTTLQDFPLPATFPLARAHLLDSLAIRLAEKIPSATVKETVPTRALLDDARREWAQVRAQMISLQEELDWEVYRHYGIINDDLTCPPDILPPLELGERAFEISLARQVESRIEEDAWFRRHRSAAVAEVPAHWPAAYREIVQRRLDLIAANRFIGLLEQPTYKRRWLVDPWEKQETEALRDWLLGRLDDPRFWLDRQGRPAPKSIAQLADEVARRADVVSVLALWSGQRDVSVAAALEKLLGGEAVPFHAGYRYKPSGLRKRRVWEETWDKQRAEDDAVAEGLSMDAARGKIGPIPAPKNYVAGDFDKPSYWHRRGKLDVPKERFILYPDAGRENDPTLMLGWAGWDHAQQALALATIIAEREAEGWDDERLVPLVAGLAELQPWVKQWHAEIDPKFGVSMAEFCREELARRAAQVRMTTQELVEWVPAKPVKKATARQAKKVPAQRKKDAGAADPSPSDT